MAKEETLEFEGIVSEILPDARCRVKLENGHEVIAYTAGRMKKNRIRILAREFHKSVILCTHILPDVRTVCDRVVILANGSVRVSDTLETLCRMPNPSVTVTVTGDCNALHELLVRRNLRSEFMPPHQLRVVGEAGALNTELWSASAETNCVIRSLTPSKNSLEQIFLDAVREDHRAHT